jgi:1-acyl-sn-glycerol-3-phosphate acyltransferase
MRFAYAVLSLVARVLGFLLIRLDARDLARLPKTGPLILAMNHVNFLDGTLLLALLFPRRVVSLAKKETWDNPVMGFIASAAGAIPLERGMSDPAALRRAATLLEGGAFLYINPEGTRSGDGILRRGKAGVVSIALATGSPVAPLAFEGLENFGPSLKRLHRAPVILHVGEPFAVKPPPEGQGKEARNEALTEIMFRIAALLPEDRRGEYAGAPPSEWKRTETRSFEGT